MRVCGKWVLPGPVLKYWRLSLLLVLLAGTAGMAADAVENGWFVVRNASTALKDEVYYLDAEFDYELSDTVKDALRNGVSLTIVVSIQVERKRWYWWNVNLADLRQRYQLSYHPLTQQYTVTYLNSGQHNRFPTLYAAIDALRMMDDLPVVDKNLVDPKYNYSVELRTYLDIEALPAPLRPVAYFSKAWRLLSNTYVCPLNP